MEKYVRVLAALGMAGMLSLLAVIVWSLTRPATVIELPTPAPVALLTVPPTNTSAPTVSPFVFVTPTKVPPTATATATPTATRPPEATATNTPRPPNTPTRPPIPTPVFTSTPTPNPFLFTNEGTPVVDPSRNGCYYISGFVRDSAGRGLPNVRLRYLIKQPALNLVYERTRQGAEAGRYELYVGLFGNEVELTIVDDDNNALSPTVPVMLSGSNCWWVLNWRRTG